MSLLVQALGLDVSLDAAPMTDTSSDNEAVNEVPPKKTPAKRGRKPGSATKKATRFSSAAAIQGCQIFRGATYQNGKK
jgi:hypothetical protein